MRKYLSIVALLVMVSVFLTACGLSEAETKYNSATDKLKANDNDGALADFNEAIRLDANLAVAYMNRAVVWIRKQDFDQAIADSSKAMELKLSRIEDQVTNLSNRSSSYSQKGEFGKALADAEEAIKLKSDYPFAYYARGLARAQMSPSDKEGAIADFKKVIELAKDSQEAKQAQELIDRLQATP
jgi:tetratricopeptide (TPR) repeat protein